MAPLDGPSHERDDSDAASEPREAEERSVWARGAIFVGLGVEFVGIPVGGLFLGYLFDWYLGTLEAFPIGIVSCFLLSLAAVAFHIYKMLDLT